MTQEITADYDAETNTILIVVPENYQMDDVFDALVSCYSKLPAGQCFNILLDAMRSQANREFSEIRNFIARSAPFRERVMRVAIVVNRLLHFGLGNQAASYASMEGFSVKPFWSRSSARKWLDQTGNFEEEQEAWNNGHQAS